MVATTCGRKHKPPYYTTQEDRLTDQRWNKTQPCWLMSEIAAQDSRDTPCPGHRCFEDFTSRQEGLSRPTPPMSPTLNRETNMNDAGSPQMSGAYHFDSRSSTHLQGPRINASQPTRSKPYSTNHREEEDSTWPFASSRAVYNSGVMCAKTILRKKTPCGIQNYKKMFATTCDVHKPP